MAKYGPAPYKEEERRLPVSLSLSNKDYPRLKRFREAFEAKEGHAPSRDELIELAQSLAYQAIDAYCEQIDAMIANTGAIIL